MYERVEREISEWASRLLENWAHTNYADDFEASFSGNDGTAGIDLELSDKIIVVDEYLSESAGGYRDLASACESEGGVFSGIGRLCSVAILNRAEMEFSGLREMSLHIKEQVAGKHGNFARLVPKNYLSSLAHTKEHEASIDGIDATVFVYTNIENSDLCVYVYRAQVAPTQSISPLKDSYGHTSRKP